MPTSCALMLCRLCVWPAVALTMPKRKDTCAVANCSVRYSPTRSGCGGRQRVVQAYIDHAAALLKPGAAVGDWICLHASQHTTAARRGCNTTANGMVLTRAVANSRVFVVCNCCRVTTMAVRIWRQQRRHWKRCGANPMYVVRCAYRRRTSRTRLLLQPLLCVGSQRWAASRSSGSSCSVWIIEQCTGSGAS